MLGKLLIVFFSLVLLRVLAGWLAKKVQLAKARRWYDVIAITSLGPSDMEIHFPEELKEVVEQVPTKKIADIAAKNRKLLEQSGNPISGKIPILQIPFQDGVNINESWLEYQERVVELIKQERAKWHEQLKEKGERGWYNKNHHKMRTHA